MGKKDNNDIYKNDELFKDFSLLEHTSSDLVLHEVENIKKAVGVKSKEDFVNLCIKIIDGQKKHIKKLEKDITEAERYILYCRDKISSMCDEREKEVRTYYHSQIEKTEAIINDKKYKINQTMKRISETENKMNRL